jgi:hypothetical protein
VQESTPQMMHTFYCRCLSLNILDT